ncbi:MAG: hypothetical protein EBS55_11410 [Flavobacteriaceae bacterium]|nr:hypothetical protein [Flavobacteriaceae bacterium]
MSKLNEIINGWANVVKDKIGTLDPKLKLMAANRLLLCNSCHMRVENTCSTKKVGINEITKKETNGCGCNISAKTLSPESKCPLSKW